VLWRDRNGANFQLPNEVAGVTPGVVTAEDYAAWRARFGNTAGSGLGTSLAAAVPEPSSLMILGAAFGGLLAIGGRCGRKRDDETTIN
jgi:PEP-CTERM motif